MLRTLSLGGLGFVESDEVLTSQYVTVRTGPGDNDFANVLLGDFRSFMTHLVDARIDNINLEEIGASNWPTQRTITLAGPLVGSVALDGSSDVTLHAVIADGALSIAKVNGLASALEAKLGSTATAVAAEKLATARTIALTGRTTGSATFDGSGNISIDTSIADNALSIAMVNGLSTQLSGKANLEGGNHFNGSQTFRGIQFFRGADAAGDATIVFGNGVDNAPGAGGELFWSQSTGGLGFHKYNANGGAYTTKFEVLDSGVEIDGNRVWHAGNLTPSSLQYLTQSVTSYAANAMNFNALPIGSKALISSSNSNAPSVAGVATWYVETLRIGTGSDASTALLQRAWSTTSAAAVTRRRESGTWSVWRETWNSETFQPNSKLGSNDTAASTFKLVQPRKITLTGAVTGNVNFDGSSDVSLATTFGGIAVADVNGLTTELDNFALKTRAWQLGTDGANLQSFSGDLNTLNGFGAVYATTEATNRPAYNCNVLNFGVANYNAQFALRNSLFSFRTQENGTWQGWNEIYHSGNLNLANYVPSTRTVSSGNGLTGGGVLSGNQTIALGTPSEISATSTNSLTTNSHTHAIANITETNNRTVLSRKEGRSGGGSVWLYPDGVDGGGIGFTTGNSVVKVRWDLDGVQTMGSVPWARLTNLPTIGAGNGLTGGGSLSGNQSIGLGTPGTLSGSTTNSVTTSSHTHALSANLKAWDALQTSDVWRLEGNTLRSDITNFSVTDNSIPSGAYVYSQTSSTGGPIQVWGVIYHTRRVAGGGEQQLFIAETNNLMAFRGRSTGAWTPWQTLHHSGNFDPASKANVSHSHTAADVGLGNLVNIDWRQFGLGSTSQQMIEGSSIDAHMGGTAGAGNRFYYHSSGSAPSDVPIAGQASGIHMGNTWGRAQMHFPNFATNRAYFRTGTTTTWDELWHTGNFTPTNIPTQSAALQIDHTAGIGLIINRNSASNSTIEFRGGSSSLHAGFRNSTTWGVGPTANLTGGAWFYVSATDAVIGGNRIFHEGNKVLNVASESIGANQNLDNYTTTGLFHQNQSANATTALNYPVGDAGMLTVSSASIMVYQTYQHFRDGRTWARSQYNGTWSTWVELSAGATIATSGTSATVFHGPGGSTGTNTPSLYLYNSGGFCFATNNGTRVRWDADGVQTHGDVPWARLSGHPSVVAGNGLSGGGALSASRTVTLGTPGTITNSTTNSVSSSSHTHALTVTKADVGLSAVENEAISSWSRTFIEDVRGGARAPNYYPARGAHWSFHDASSINGNPPGDTYTAALTVYPWGNFHTGHRPQQLAFTGTGGLKFRHATSDTAWAAWQNIAMGDVDSLESANTIVQRTSANDINARLFRSSFGDQSSLGSSSSIAFRNNNSSDNYIRFCNSPTALLGWLGLSSSSTVNFGTLTTSSTGSTPSLFVERTGNNINSSIGYRNTTGTIYAGHGDPNTFGFGSGDDIRWNASGTYATIASDGIRVKGFLDAGGTVAGSFVTATNNRFYGGTTGDVWTVGNGSNGIGWRPRGWATANQMFLANNGNLSVSGTVTATDFIISSDRKLKRDIVDLAVAKEGWLQPKTYFHIETDEIENGFVAQDVKKLYPRMVTKRPDGKLAIKYPRITAALARQDLVLRDELRAQNKRIKQLEKLVKKLLGK